MIDESPKERLIRFLKQWFGELGKPTVLLSIIAIVLSTLSLRLALKADDSRAVLIHPPSWACVSREGENGAFLVSFPVIFSNPGGQSAAVIVESAWFEIGYSLPTDSATKVV